MSAVGAAPHDDAAASSGLGPALAAVRARLGLIALLLALAAVAWWSTTARMRGMDDGPGTDLGALAWFLGVWVAMMAAMMLPSVAPTVALHARMTRRRSPIAPLAFAAGYLITWTAAGLLAYGAFTLGRELLGDALLDALRDIHRDALTENRPAGMVEGGEELDLMIAVISPH